MSAAPPVTPPAAPIEPAPAGRGCAKNALIGCGVAALIVVLGFVALVFYIQKRPTVITDFMMKQIEGHYAPDVTEAEKEELRAAYASFRTAVEQGKAGREPMERVRATLTFRSGGSNEITREQVRELTQAFREAAGAPSGAASPQPAPEAPTTPSPEGAATPAR